ncbi:DUF4097 family beta strand repeat protein [candidate division WOR-3 bacterium]|uniref:DUF4097 family beta strand repeat protein n=1 Tax=candidate division WOR-3 bacterium TaxID=2052148 RepID=A0A9D5QD68_UNCW3|nr:DUF4097 family beta strand repeat protein [candidate division WOR-3 bacterium]MBD3364797.1 DUF4097 family beta strand repeat protein [candidate division WOR-3 bacterium]
MKRWLVVLPILAVLFSGCEVVFNTPAEESYEETFAVSDGYTRIDLDNESGNVIVNAVEGDSIIVEYTKKCMGSNDRDANEHLNDIDVTLKGTAGQITITAEFPTFEETRNYEAIFTITAPPDIIMELSANKGNIDISGMTTSPVLNTTQGDITIADFECDVDATSGDGDIECSLDVLPDSGNVNLTTEDGYQTLVIKDMDTTGTIILSASGIGEINATLPSDAKLDFDLECVTGEVRIEGFPTEDITYTEQGNKKKVGTIGEGTRATFTASSEEGDVNLKAAQ